MPYTHPDFIEYPLGKKHQNQWCFILCKISQNQTSLPYLMSLYHDDSQEWEETQYLQSTPFLCSSYKMGILYISPNSQKIGITSIEHTKSLSKLTSIKIIPLSRLIAAGLLVLLNPVSILKVFIGSPQHLKKRLRTALNQNYTQSDTNLSYNTWLNLYDVWRKKEKEILYQSQYVTDWPKINLKIYGSSDSTYTDIDNGVDQQWETPKKAKHTYVAILQNGEILPAHASAIFADQAARHHFPAALYADSDLLDHNNQRVSPCFKPKIGTLTLLSGFLTQDIWLFRQDIIEKYHQQIHVKFQTAYAYRLALALYVWEQQLRIHHIPFILSHRRIAPSAQALKEMQQTIHTQLSCKNWQFNINQENFPIKIKLYSTNNPVSIIIPTTISSKTIRNCIQSILKNTKYPDFEVILVISQNNSLSKQQRKYIRPLLKYKNLRIVWLKTNQFNFSASCNFGIRYAKHEFIGVVNDDIWPKTPYWLDFMMGHMQDQNVGAVGGKLYYPNGQIQHAGILMGAANLCEHIGRFEHSERFTLTYDHDISAVTAACMLIRRSAYTQVHGFDENYEIAYNDVDFCLKLRQANFKIIQCQQAKLTHFESLSLGNHYTGIRAGKERQEILSIRSKYKAICDNDPFYNPNLSLQRGMDEKLAFPTRITRPFAISFSLNK
ncbi:glycosyltransferase [Commensalibacter papalotli (ex Botero et al. 2024)]|uniref:GT2 family (WcaE) (PDB:2Z86) n=1 Tax=Commensalibacter papalotli (ex Botero et al. 2024) TaxID=2972766 RepID=A0ABM9HPJ6_9PROT|nr:glycosyltransferase [Commensalibacter papalotli (ex Botero et al. 2024)]CAI3933701.1 GT2 family (WcaE) (PDB:2Z86) [Commensalibacter papalotli (ex Botero et al. 2024)]CAI3941941.1 GT2 family (WcaE) (PDB:2Z86) [Commensalibacter papalotli (ex Botero et al. 2024)]